MYCTQKWVNKTRDATYYDFVVKVRGLQWHEAIYTLPNENFEYGYPHSNALLTFFLSTNLQFANYVICKKKLTIILLIALSIKCLLLDTSAVCIQMHSRLIFHRSKHYEPWSDCSFRSSLIWVHIVCNIGHQNTKPEERADDDRHEYWQKGSKKVLFVWFDSLCPINNLSVKQGRLFFGWTSTMLG